MNNAIDEKRISANRFDAVIFDLDGVITRTAKVHAAAWKAIFDDLLAKRSFAGEQHEPFNIETDYREYVDGKPRYDGVHSFLKARGIELPYGDPNDAPDQETICGLGNRKNELFLKKLHTDGVEVYASSITLIRALRDTGIRIAVVSSSRNCKAVLKAAGLCGLLDACVDGTDLQRLGLAGKPAPDMFVEASHRLNIDPQRAIGVEDATVGVQAAKAAGFGCVIGVDRGKQAAALSAHGADIVVNDLCELHLADESTTATELPLAFDCLIDIVPADDQMPVLFLDYDGTLTPIVDHPDDAVLSDSMRTILKRLSGLCRFTVISGRRLDDVRERVGIEGIWYAGSHGFNIAGPKGQRKVHQEGIEYLPMLDKAEQALREKLAGIPGCLVERKRFDIATHYRQVEDENVATVKRIVDQTLSAHPGLRLITGKKVLELQPDIDWDKGKALRWLMQTLDVNSDRSIPIYIGDDVTDEDAFRELVGSGIGILVTQRAKPTCAAYRLDDPAAVEEFLSRLADRLQVSKP